MHTVSIAKSTVLSLLERLLALLPLLAASASAIPCSSTQYDMLNWFAMGASQE